MKMFKLQNDRLKRLFIKGREFLGKMYRMAKAMSAFRMVRICASVLTVSAIFAVAFAVIPKETSLLLRASPSDFRIDGFRGDYVAVVRRIGLYDGELTNVFPVIMKTDSGQQYTLKARELKIAIKNRADRAGTERTDKTAGGEPAEISFSSRAVILSDDNMSGDIRLHEETNRLDRKMSLDIKSIEGKRYDVSVRSANGNSGLLNLMEETRVAISGMDGVEITACDEKLDLNEEGSAAFDIMGRKSDLVMLHYSSEDMTMIGMKTGLFCHFRGTAGSFRGRAGVTGTNRLEWSHLREQKNIDISTMEILAVPKKRFDAEYAFNGKENSLVVSGQAKDASVNGTSLGDTIGNFFYENLAVFFCAVYAAIMADAVLNGSAGNGENPHRRKAE